MLDVELLRKQAGMVRANFERRHNPEVLARLDEFLAADQRWRRQLAALDALRAERNKLSEAIGAAKRAKQEPSPDLVARSKAIPDQLARLDGDVQGLRTQLDSIAKRLPNLLHESVPEGKDSSENVQAKVWGEPLVPAFEVKSHGDLVEAMGLADFTRAAKTAGAGFVYLLGDLVRLDFALQAFAMAELSQRGFTPIEVPLMLRREPYEGVTDLADFENVMYKVQGEDLYLIATSEHAIGAMHMDEVLSEDALPLRYAGISACFRREIGAHGVDTKGLFRMHQFNKIEQFVFCAPEDSWKIHEEILENALHIFRSLEVPHRVVNVCTGDIGTVAAKKYDVEAWSPRQKKWIEVVSCSNCTDYQARRLKIRCGKVGGEKRVAHTLNSTAVATSRAMVAILENHQQADGSVTIPKALRPYMGGATALAAAKG
ncbi:MAG TPA: serine--tRNA ligase [Candidatus Thermoplasmatota archaeon]|jgi:seryl-tRNA synthetase|nr:serine--tRNA ligase [Candidatus Thermoplasmatota archaeon]